MENTLAARLRSSWWIARCILHWPFFFGCKKCGKMSWEDTGLTIVDFYHLPSSRQKIWALSKLRMLHSCWYYLVGTPIPTKGWIFNHFSRQSEFFLLEYSINFMSLRMTPLPNCGHYNCSEILLDCVFVHWYGAVDGWYNPVGNQMGWLQHIEFILENLMEI